MKTSPSGPRLIVGRAIGHAVRMLAMPAAGRHVEVGVGPAGLAVEARQALMGVGAGALAIVAADAELLVDEQHVGRLADAVLDQEAGDRAVHVDDAAEAVLARLDIVGELLARRHVLLEPAEQIGLAPEQAAERLAVEPDHLRLDRGADRRGAAAAVDQRHLADIGAGRQ